VGGLTDGPSYRTPRHTTAIIASALPPTLRNRGKPMLAEGTKHERRTPADRVSAYYDQTWIDYRWLWLGTDNLAIHFGYCDATTRSHADGLVNMNCVLADCAGIRPGERVLDAGCGVGGSSLWLARQCGARVVGITPVASQVQRARRFAQRRGLAGQVSFEQADYADTHFPASIFDVVWALESVCHAPSKLDFYREVVRVLRPGGRLVMAEYIRRARPLKDAGERLLHEWLDGWAIPDLDTREEHLGHVANAGLAGVRLDDVTPHVDPSLRRLYLMSSRLMWLARLGRALRLRTVVQHGNVVGSVRQYQALQEGCWFYGILSAEKLEA
jgi:cyclopropane fatty-acyl-phospholipid synthase-like methyltransferase